MFFFLSLHDGSGIQTKNGLGSRNKKLHYIGTRETITDRDTMNSLTIFGGFIDWHYNVAIVLNALH